MTAQELPASAEARQGMFCDRCGQYAISRRTLVADTGEFQCAHCQRHFTRRVLPLFIVTGASGVGKTSIISALQQQLPGYAVLDKDLMWARDWDMAYNNFFRIASSLAQTGLYTIIVGTIIPEHLQGLSDRDLVGSIGYAILHCDDQTRRQRLLTRREWGLPSEEFIRTHEAFARWLLEHAERDFGEPMVTFDTSTAAPEAIAAAVALWIQQKTT